MDDIFMSWIYELKLQKVYIWLVCLKTVNYFEIKQHQVSLMFLQGKQEQEISARRS